MEQAAEVCVDLEYCVIINNANEEAGSGGENLQGAKPVFTKSCDHNFMISSPDDHLGTVDLLKANMENMKNSCVMVLIDGKLEAVGAAGKSGKEKRKKAAAASSSSAKKPPKPPQPHTGGFSLDATDQKLIKELAELATIKRARIERMKALMQKKAATAANSSSKNSSSSLFAMLFTILVFLVLLFQGMSCQISCGTFRGSPPATQANESSFIFIQEELNPSAHDSV